MMHILEQALKFVYQHPLVLFHQVREGVKAHQTRLLFHLQKKHPNMLDESTAFLDDDSDKEDYEKREICKLRKQSVQMRNQTFLRVVWMNEDIIQNMTPSVSASESHTSTPSHTSSGYETGSEDESE